MASCNAYTASSTRATALGLLESGNITGAVAHLAASSSSTQEEGTVAVDDVIEQGMAQLRADPWLMLGVPRGEAEDAAVKMAFRKLALKLHPDKNQGSNGPVSTALFACLYSAYETLATEKGRAGWWKRREREEAERKAAADHGGAGAVEELEVRWNRERREREREHFKEWGRTQQDTLRKWRMADERDGERRREEEEFRNLRLMQDQSRQRRSTDRELKVRQRKHQGKIKTSKKIQSKYQNEIDMRLANMASLNANIATLPPKRPPSKVFPPVPRSRPSKVAEVALAKRGTGSGLGSGSGSLRGSPPKGSTATATGPTTSAGNNSGRDVDGVDENESVDGCRIVNAVFKKAGPMGFTLEDISARVRAEKNKKDGADGDGDAEWSVSVMRLEREVLNRPGEAELLGVMAGDVLTTVNGCDLRCIGFKEVCRLLGESTFPRRLRFQRR